MVREKEKKKSTTKRVFDPLRTASPLWGQIPWNQTDIYALCTVQH